MATTSSKCRQLWRADWCVAVPGLHEAADFFDAFERRYYDFASTSTARQPSARAAREDAPDISGIHEDLPDRLAEVVAMEFAQKPEHHYQDGARFAAELRAASPARGQPGSAASAVPAPVSVDVFARVEATVTQAVVAVPEAIASGTYDATRPAYGEKMDSFEKTVISAADVDPEKK